MHLQFNEFSVVKFNDIIGHENTTNSKWISPHCELIYYCVPPSVNSTSWANILKTFHYKAL